MPDTDHPLKRLVALATEDFASWLLQQPVHLVGASIGAWRADRNASGVGDAATQCAIRTIFVFNLVSIFV